MEQEWLGKVLILLVNMFQMNTVKVSLIIIIITSKRFFELKSVEYRDAIKSKEIRQG